jgi:hypothetical protein
VYDDQRGSFDYDDRVSDQGGESFDYEDNNDDIMYQQCDYDKKGKWRDDGKYNRDQYEECESKRYS